MFWYVDINDRKIMLDSPVHVSLRNISLGSKSADYLQFTCRCLTYDPSVVDFQLIRSRIGIAECFRRVVEDDQQRSLFAIIGTETVTG